MKALDKFVNWYLRRKQKEKVVTQKRIQDEKLDQALTQLKALYDFVKFLNEKAFKNRHERKTFWLNVANGTNILETTLMDLMEKYGAKKESIEELKKRKAEKDKQQEENRKAQEKHMAEIRRVKGLSFIEGGVCKNEGQSICNLGYACDGCPYNKEKKAVKKQIIDAENNINTEPPIVTEKKDETKS